MSAIEVGDSGAGPNDLCSRAEHSIERMQSFLAGWIRGDLENSPEVFSRLEDLLAPAMHIIGPSGEFHDRSNLLAFLAEQHGRDPNTERWVEDMVSWEISAGIVVVRFHEWQVRDGVRLGARISVVCEDIPPDRVQWLHIHESRITEG